MKNMRNRKWLLIAVTAMLAVSSCGSPQNAPAVTETYYAQTAPASETTITVAETGVESSADTGFVTVTDDTGITAFVTESTEITETSVASVSVEEPETGEYAESTVPAETAEPYVSEEAVTQITEASAFTEAVTEAVTEAPVVTSAEMPRTAAKPSPSQVKEVSSPGKTVFGPDKAKFDYSNCSKGYVSVNYTGKTKLKMLLKKDGEQYDYDIPAGKGIQYFTLSMGSGKYVVEIYEMVSGGKYVKLFSDTFSAKIADTTNMYLYRNQYINFTATSKCVAKASEVCAGCTTNLQKISAVFKYVTDNIKYDKALAATVTSGYIPNPDSVLAKKKGICFDYASLTAAMLRSQGVPTRLVIGYASPNIYHAWNEVYTPEKGWIAAEIQLDGTGFRRIDTTFYASASNKKTFADYIAKSGNYSDVYIY